MGGSTMNRVVVIGLVCVLAFTQSSWGKNAQSENIAGGLCDIVIDIVTAPCYLLAACLGMDNQPCLTPQKKLVTCVPAKTVSHSPYQSASQKKIPTASPPAPPRTVRQMQSETPRTGEADTPHSAPPVKIEKFIPQDKQLAPEPLPREVRLPEPTPPAPPAPPSVPQPPAVTKSVPPEELLTVPSKQEILEKFMAVILGQAQRKLLSSSQLSKWLSRPPLRMSRLIRANRKKSQRVVTSHPACPFIPCRHACPGITFADSLG